MSRGRAADDWNEMACLDPHWAILVAPERKYRGWESPEGLEEFFETGEQVVGGLMTQLETHLEGLARSSAMDFGCGVGRLTRALGVRFEVCDGVDISESMVSRARSLNADFPNCRFHVSTGPRLDIFEDEMFDFVLSLIVLQHVPSRDAVFSYLSEFARVLRPGGVMAFQLPSHIPLYRRIQPRRRLYRLLRALGIAPETIYNRFGVMPIPMHFIPEHSVRAFISSVGGEIEVVLSDQSAGPGIDSRLYVVRKPGSQARESL